MKEIMDVNKTSNTDTPFTQDLEMVASVEFENLGEDLLGHMGKISDELENLGKRATTE